MSFMEIDPYTGKPHLHSQGALRTNSARRSGGGLSAHDREALALAARLQARQAAEDAMVLNAMRPRGVLEALSPVSAQSLANAQSLASVAHAQSLRAHSSEAEIGAAMQPKSLVAHLQKKGNAR